MAEPGQLDAVRVACGRVASERSSAACVELSRALEPLSPLALAALAPPLLFPLRVLLGHPETEKDERARRALRRRLADEKQKQKKDGQVEGALG